LIIKKEKATKLIKAYSFKRWKLMSSRTLKYIDRVRKSMDKKEESVEERYKKIVTERLGGRSRALTQLIKRKL
jgi:cytidylate kinase